MKVVNTGVVTIQPNAVALSTDTTGNYVASVTEGAGITVTPTTYAEGAAVTVVSTLGTAIDSAEITNGAIVNEDISASANISLSKLGGGLTPGWRAVVAADGTLTATPAGTVTVTYHQLDGTEHGGQIGAASINVNIVSSLDGVSNDGGDISIRRAGLIDLASSDAQNWLQIRTSIPAGAIADASLTSNVPLLNLGNEFTQSQVITNTAPVLGLLDTTASATSYDIGVNNNNFYILEEGQASSRGPFDYAGATKLFTVYGNFATSPLGSAPGNVTAAGTVSGVSFTRGSDVITDFSGNGLKVTASALQLGNLTADWAQAGAFDIRLDNAASELRILESAGGVYYLTLDAPNLTADRAPVFQDKAGTLAFLSDITAASFTGNIPLTRVSGTAGAITNASLSATAPPRIAGGIRSASIYNLDLNKVQISALAIPAASLANLDMSKITTGNLAITRIPIAAGAIPSASLAALDMSKISTGNLALGRVSGTANAITSASLATNIPLTTFTGNLPATRLSGTSGWITSASVASILLSKVAVPAGAVLEASVAENFWDRTGTRLFPETAGDIVAATRLGVSRVALTGELVPSTTNGTVGLTIDDALEPVRLVIGGVTDSSGELLILDIGQVNRTTGVLATQRVGVSIGHTGAAAVVKSRWAGGGAPTGLQLGVETTPDAISVDTSGNTAIKSGKTFTLGGDAFDELVGTGLQITSGDLQTTLGTTIESSEITNGTIVDADIHDVDWLKVQVSAGDILSASLLSVALTKVAIVAGAIIDASLATIATAGKVSDSALSANVALENVANVFTQDQTISNTTPVFALTDTTAGGDDWQFRAGVYAADVVDIYSPSNGFNPFLAWLAGGTQGRVILAGDVAIATAAAGDSGSLNVYGQVYSSRYASTVTSGTVTFNFNNGNHQSVVTTGNIGVTYSNVQDGGSYTLLIKYGGAHTVTLAAGKFATVGGTVPTFTSTNAKWDYLTMKYDGATARMSLAPPIANFSNYN
ncbi:MAG: hypothetical protein A2Y38_02590 [Spirochaetes bacterium GWB1_59_5]|nr:MAG: hypothetical protein A2Y38_02590 [Spirochaetes bacterium GWB1_59_5]